jgi:hypothetical protein
MYLDGPKVAIFLIFGKINEDFAFWGEKEGYITPYTNEPGSKLIN